MGSNVRCVRAANEVMAVCFTGPPLIRWRSCRPALGGLPAQLGATTCRAHISGPRSSASASASAAAAAAAAAIAPPAASLFVSLSLLTRAFECAEARLRKSRCGGRTPRHHLAGRRWPASDRAQRQGGTCWSGQDNTALTRPPRPCKGDTTCTASAGFRLVLRPLRESGRSCSGDARARDTMGSLRQYGLLSAVQEAEGGFLAPVLEGFQKVATSRGDLREESSSPSTICPHGGPAHFLRLHSMAYRQSFSSCYLSRDAVALQSCTQDSRYCSSPFPPLS
jgi:hypothetical protein